MEYLAQSRCSVPFYQFLLSVAFWLLPEGFVSEQTLSRCENECLGSEHLSALLDQGSHLLPEALGD
jgi:hypothetical protein